MPPKADGEVNGRGVLGVSGPEKPGGGKNSFPPTVVDKHSGLWTRRREFESLPGYQNHHISISFLSQNNINLTESTPLSSVIVGLIVAAFKLSGDSFVMIRRFPL